MPANPKPINIAEVQYQMGRIARSSLFSPDTRDAMTAVEDALIAAMQLCRFGPNEPMDNIIRTFNGMARARWEAENCEPQSSEAAEAEYAAMLAAVQCPEWPRYYVDEGPTHGMDWAVRDRQTGAVVMRFDSRDEAEQHAQWCVRYHAHMESVKFARYAARHSGNESNKWGVHDNVRGDWWQGPVLSLSEAENLAAHLNAQEAAK